MYPSGQLSHAVLSTLLRVYAAHKVQLALPAVEMVFTAHCVQSPCVVSSLDLT